MNIQDIVKVKLNDESFSEALIDINIQDFELRVKNYCNIDTVPESLNYAIADMVTDSINFENYSKNADKITKSVTRGDVSISYADKKLSDKDTIFKSYIKILNGYRKLRK